MKFTEHKAALDPEHAAHFVALTRSLLDDLRAIDGEDVFERRRDLLRILGYPCARDEDELNALIRTLSKSVHPSRSGGIH